MIKKFKNSYKKIKAKTNEKYKDSKFSKLQQRYKFAIIVSAFVLIWILSGLFSFKNETEQKNKENQLATVQIKTSHSSKVMREINIYGQAEAYQKVPIKAKTKGNVAKIYAKKGRLIKKGDLILTLTLEDRISRLEAAKATIEQSKLQYKATEALSHQELASQSVLTQSEAQYKSAKAQLNSINLDISNTKIRAPFSGTLDNITVDVGDYINPGTPIATILNLDPIKIKASVSEKHRPLVEIGSVAEIHTLIDNGNDKKIIEAVLTYVASSANPVNRTYEIELEALNPDNHLTDGMTVEIILPLGMTEAHKINNYSMVTLNEEGDLGIKVIDDDNTVQFIKAELIKEEKEGAWISGLPNKARIIVSGQEYVKTGEKVIPVEATDVSEKANSKKEIFNNETNINLDTKKEAEFLELHTEEENLDTEEKTKD